MNKGTLQALVLRAFSSLNTEVEAEKRLRVGRSSDGLENEGRRAGRREGKIPQKVPNLT